MIKRIDIVRLNRSDDQIVSTAGKKLTISVKRGDTVTLINEDMNYPVNGPCHILVTLEAGEKGTGE